MRDGRIMAAGRNVAIPANARVIQVTGKWVTPGIVAGFSRLGLVDVDAVDPANDTSAKASPYGAAQSVAPAINPQVEAIGVSREAGVTRAIVAPEAGKGIFAGQGVVIDLATDYAPVTRENAFQFVEYGEAGADKAGGSRGAAWLDLRYALEAAQATTKGRAALSDDGKDTLILKRDAEALVPYVRGERPLMIHVERASDIVQVLDLRTVFPAMRLVLVGASEGWLVADRIKAAGVSVIGSALNDLPNQFDKLAATQSNIGRMQRAGVAVSIGMIDDSDTRQAQNLPQYAGNLVALTRVPGATGLNWDQAFRAISAGPAEAIGMGDAIGSLRPGRHADVVIWDGDPLELASAPERLWIDGVEQSLVSRQTRLRDRYATPKEGALPKAYDR
jgi:imidazolonepropionase-like amidohydrolase